MLYLGEQKSVTVIWKHEMLLSGPLSTKVLWPCLLEHNSLRPRIAPIKAWGYCPSKLVGHVMEWGYQKMLQWNQANIEADWEWHRQRTVILFNCLSYLLMSFVSTSSVLSVEKKISIYHVNCIGKLMNTSLLLPVEKKYQFTKYFV